MLYMLFSIINVWIGTYDIHHTYKPYDTDEIRWDYISRSQVIKQI